MNRDQIKAIANESGIDFCSSDHAILTFASRIESLVREECAQVCESFCDGNSMTANELADIIRKS
jgi:hypothetical protein